MTEQPPTSPPRFNLAGRKIIFALILVAASLVGLWIASGWLLDDQTDVGWNRAAQGTESSAAAPESP